MVALDLSAVAGFAQAAASIIGPVLIILAGHLWRQHNGKHSRES